MIRTKNPLLTVLAALACLGPTVQAETEVGPAQLGLEDMRTFAEVFGRIQRDYVEETRDRELLENAIRGMLSELDPHTAYLTREEFADLEADTSGRYGGIGIEVLWFDDELRVQSVKPGSPAAKAGLAAEDLIVAIDGREVSDMEPPDAVSAVRGEPGTPVELGIRSPGSQAPREVTVLREVIRVESVEHRLFGGRYAYIRILSFQTDTVDAVSEALAELARSAGGRLDGLVLDLRSNPGGVLNAAVGVADLFLTGGRIVSTRGRVAEAELDYSAGPEDELLGAPIVAMVDEGTASASEIVAGALQDHHRAVIIGEPTFGKGSVQTVLPLRNGGAIKLTTARYYTPSGRSIQAHGIHPDIDTSGDYRSRVAQRETPEARLDGHLSGEAEGARDADQRMLALAEEDYSLYRALMLLRGVNLLGRADTVPPEMPPDS